MENLQGKIKCERIKKLYKYLKSDWKINHMPTIEQAKFELEYNISFEIGLTTTMDFNDLFEGDLFRLEKLNKVVVCYDHRNIRRIYPPDEKLIKELANRLYMFLKPIWEGSCIPRKITVYAEFAFLNKISRDQFEKAFSLLKNFKVIETLTDNYNGIRIIKSTYSESNIVKIMKSE